MAQRVFVKVIGFTDVERHALNSLFRLSEERETIYSLWAEDAPEAPRLALVDGLSEEARVGFVPPGEGAPKVVWVDGTAPPYAWRTYERPLSWPEVVRAMDELFSPVGELDFDFDTAPGAMDLDLGIGVEAQDTVPPADGADAAPRPKRALIASADRDERLYLRAKLALAKLPYADEAESGAQALEFARDNDYHVALVDFSLPDFEGWTFIRELQSVKRRIPHVVVTKRGATLGERLRAWLKGLSGFFDKPPHPGKLQSLLERAAS